MRHKAAIATQPGECSLDHPSPPHDLEAAALVGALDDLKRNRLRCKIGLEFGACISAIGKDLSDEWELSARPGDEVSCAIAILYVCRNDLDAKQQAYCINERITLDALGFLARIVADRIDIAPPFSVAFTACVSMMAAVGEASRPSASRH